MSGILVPVRWKFGVVVAGTGLLLAGTVPAAIAGTVAGQAGYLPWSVPGPATLDAGGVSCPSSGVCVTVGSDLSPNTYYADRLSSSSWSSTTVPSPPEATDRNSAFSFLPGVSCSSASFCAAVGDTC